MKTIILSSACVIAALSWSVSGAAPVSDPLVKWAQETARPNQFYLNTQRDREVVRYPTTRDVKVCVPLRSSGTMLDTPDRNVPMRVTWDQSYTATVTPGSCMNFEAKQVSLAPARSLSDGVSVRGDIATLPQPSR